MGIQPPRQVETLDLLDCFEDSNSVPVATSAIADDWMAFPSDAPTLQQPPASQQQQPQFMDALEQRLGAMCVNSSIITQPVPAETVQQPNLPTLLSNRCMGESHATKVDDIQKSLASLYAQPTANKFVALDIEQMTTAQVSGTQQLGGMQQMMGLQQFGGMQQMMGTQPSGMQQLGGGLQQLGGNQQAMSAQQITGMQQFGGMQQIKPMHGMPQFSAQGLGMQLF